MRTLATRLTKLEQQHQGPDGFELWIGGDDDDPMLGPNGETMNRVEFDVLYPDAIHLSKGSNHEEPR